MVARLLWEQDAAGSSPVTSTTTKPLFELRVIFRDIKKFLWHKKSRRFLPPALFIFLLCCDNMLQAFLWVTAHLYQTKTL